VREPPSVPELLIAAHFGIGNEGRAGDAWLIDTVRRAWKMKVFPYVQVEIEGQLRERAEREVIHLYARSLRDLLMAAPAGARMVMGLEPGLRTGVKAAVVIRPDRPRDGHRLPPAEERVGSVDRHAGGPSAARVGSWGSATAPGRARRTACCRTWRSAGRS
jgi:uncharacterized protein